jgi:transcriptional regulator with PAS, ATPase and Fis domain
MNRERRQWIEELRETHEAIRKAWRGTNTNFRYSQEQKRIALNAIDQHGVRAVAQILGVPRRTLQRWCRKQGKQVKRCPDWVRPWAAKRRERRKNWIW